MDLLSSDVCILSHMLLQQKKKKRQSGRDKARSNELKIQAIGNEVNARENTMVWTGIETITSRYRAILLYD